MRISDWSSDVCSSDLTPHALGRMQIFEPKPIETEEVLLYEQDGGYKLIPATERGAPWIQQIRRQGRIRALSTVALRKQDTLRAGELMGVASVALRSEEHTSELQSLMRISYAVFCLKKKKYRSNI